MLTKRPLALVLASAVAISCTVNVSRTNSNVEDDNMQRDDGNGAGTSKPQPTATATTPPNDKPGEGMKICTKKGCSNILDVELHPGAGGWGRGTYTVELTADGKRATCEVKLPLPACDKGKSATCKGDVDVMVMESGCDKKPEEHAIAGLHFTGTPKEVALVVKKNKQRFLEADLRPKYKTLQPNGPDCDPTCSIGEEKVCKDKCP